MNCRPLRRRAAWRSRLPRVTGLLPGRHLLDGTLSRRRQRLVAVADDESAFRGFAGATEAAMARFVSSRGPRRRMPWRCGPRALAEPSRFGLHTSAGFGDRLGLATPGHVRALKRSARRSIRYSRSVHPGDRALPANPARCARRRDVGAFQAGWTQPVGGDADHLEDDDIGDTAAAGFVVDTLDPKLKSTRRRSTPTGDDPAEGGSTRLGGSGFGPDEFIKEGAVTSATVVDLGREAVGLDEESVLRALAKYGRSLAQRDRRVPVRLMEKDVDCEVEYAVRRHRLPVAAPAERIVVVERVAAGSGSTGLRLCAPRLVEPSRGVWATSAASTGCGVTTRILRTPSCPGTTARPDCPCAPAPTVLHVMADS